MNSQKGCSNDIVSSTLSQTTEITTSTTDDDLDIGSGLTLKDFPYAYIPPNPYGDNSSTALKLVFHSFVN